MKGTSAVMATHEPSLPRHFGFAVSTYPSDSCPISRLGKERFLLILPTHPPRLFRRIIGKAFQMHAFRISMPSLSPNNPSFISSFISAVNSSGSVIFFFRNQHHKSYMCLVTTIPNATSFYSECPWHLSLSNGVWVHPLISRLEQQHHSVGDPRYSPVLAS